MTVFLIVMQDRKRRLKEEWNKRLDTD
jgi:hypothetical protein